jgi:hypothetical protein
MAPGCWAHGVMLSVIDAGGCAAGRIFVTALATVWVASRSVLAARSKDEWVLAGMQG